MAYPWHLGFSMARDMTPLATANSVSVLWTCYRCKHGSHYPGTATPTPDHTRSKGCRFDKKAVPPGGVLWPEPGASPTPMPEQSALPKTTEINAPPDSLPGSSDDHLRRQTSTETPGTDLTGSDRGSSAVDSSEKPPQTPVDKTTARNSAQKAPPLEPLPKVMELPDYIEPSFSLRSLKKQLSDDKLTDAAISRLLMGLHYKLWHIPSLEMQRFLTKGGFSKRVVDLAKHVSKACKECRAWTPTLTKPVAAGCTIATFFNERLQTDLFMLWERTYVIFVDEAIRWALSQFLANKTAQEWYTVFLNHWVRYFGPPRTIVSDQEGAVISDLISRACETFEIDRDLQGSEGHTKTGLAERRLGIVKLGALKLWAQTQKQGLRISQDDCVSEACSATNSVLVYNACSPNQALLGYEPRDLYTIDNQSLGASTDALSSAPDNVESRVRARLYAKEAITQAVIEHRIAEAHNTRVQQYSPADLASLAPGKKLDLWREPEDKSQTGWRGPVESLKLQRDAGTIIIEWKGHPLLVPLRLVRPHVGFVWLLVPNQTPAVEEEDHTVLVS